MGLLLLIDTNKLREITLIIARLSARIYWKVKLTRITKLAITAKNP